MRINLTDYIDTLETSIKALDAVRDVYVFGGKPSEDDLKRIKLQPNSITVLLTASGGELVKSPDPKAVDSKVIFGAYVIGPANRQGKYLGYAPELINATQSIIGCIKDLKQNSATPHQTQLLPAFREWGEMAAPISNSSSHSCWYIVWEQHISLNLEN